MSDLKGNDVAVKGEILDVLVEGDTKRIIFQHSVDGVIVVGPTSERRPADEDQDAWLAANAQALQDDMDRAAAQVVVDPTKALADLTAKIESIKSGGTIDDLIKSDEYKRAAATLVDVGAIAAVADGGVLVP